jgi:5-methylcytosine-specific restriction endonuclease McrA
VPNATTPRRRRIDKATRAYVLQRDNYRCWICRSSTPRADTVDHIKPVAHGGTDLISNLKAAHQLCNSRRGNRAERTATGGYVR